MRKVNHQQRRRGGFSLLELLLVLVILGVLAALIVPKFAGRSQDARLKAAATGVSSIQTAIDAFEIDNGRYPTAAEGLEALVDEPNNADNWSGPYLSLRPDPWGNPYEYEYPGQQNPNGFDVYSLGPDGRQGNDDIGNWAAEE